jgi:death-on-curing family protein
VQSYGVPALCKQIHLLSNRGCVPLASNLIPHWFIPLPSIWPHSTALPKSSGSLCRLGASYVQFIHDDLVAVLWPGTDPIDRSEHRDQGLLESALGRPFQSAFGSDAYATLFEKSAALFQSLVTNHAFANGNKRTAVVALDHFLAANSHWLVADDQAMYDLARATASYRSRGLATDASLREILDVLHGAVATFSQVNDTLSSQDDARLRGVYGDLQTLRDTLRSDRRNSLL